MKRLLSMLAILTILLAQPLHADDSDEISLYNSAGKPVAYIADDLTIYLWSGKPVAYLYLDGNVLQIYGFNGKHLGWFSGGIVRDHDGDAECGVKDVISSPQFEPFKAFKQFKPFKSFKEFAPFRPAFSKNWSDVPCSIALAAGIDD